MTDEATKRVLVTGGNKGIGLAIVRGILAHGPETVAILGSRDPGRGAEARDALRSEDQSWGDRLELLEIDVSSAASVQEAAQGLARRFGDDDGGAPLYGLVNNAGIAHGEMAAILDVNVAGVKRVTDAFVPLLQRKGRIVNVTSGAAPSFVEKCTPERQKQLTDPAIRWEDIDGLMAEALRIEAEGGSFPDAGFGDGRAYGLSKALANALTLLTAREHPELQVLACTPGFIETDLTRPMAESRGATPAELGMKTPGEGAETPLKLLFGAIEGTGRYFGSDGERSPMHRYRSPGSPPYQGD
ncbi:MAG TPA: SDR family NAD(P)-dependent oxidoreductase [Polyangiaceae bacterium LLY-WYZ-14_1]|nr:SDR family NAD(P)-dependent oxidoreductase [Polyangiaceae bacterium LLY-WYZ-14_1]